MVAVWVRGGGAGAWEEARLVVVAVVELKCWAWGLFIAAGRRSGGRVRRWRVSAARRAARRALMALGRARASWSGARATRWRRGDGTWAAAVSTGRRCAGQRRAARGAARHARELGGAHGVAAWRVRRGSVRVNGAEWGGAVSGTARWRGGDGGRGVARSAGAPCACARARAHGQARAQGRDERAGEAGAGVWHSSARRARARVHTAPG